MELGQEEGKAGRGRRWTGGGGERSGPPWLPELPHPRDRSKLNANFIKSVTQTG